MNAISRRPGGREPPLAVITFSYTAGGAEVFTRAPGPGPDRRRRGRRAPVERTTAASLRRQPSRAGGTLLRCLLALHVLGQELLNVMPRMHDLPRELRGSRVFGLLKQPGQDQVSAEAADEIALALRARLRPGPSTP
ncbi:hypothetical protein [Streptomyces sp. NPDC058739]|uniref:hypothetical protein n=1 Tax=Streptomyces sp. NPDC058739 TaxID=3346618 RepID=UPI00367EA911